MTLSSLHWVVNWPVFTINLPYIDVITELISLSDIYTPHDVDQDADDSEVKWILVDLL